MVCEDKCSHELVYYMKILTSVLVLDICARMKVCDFVELGNIGKI